eukprot:gene9029-10663_t
MLAYLLLYTSFYIVLRNEYLFGMDASSSELMELYTSDLKACWHAEGEESVATKLPMQITFHSEHNLQALRNADNSTGAMKCGTGELMKWLQLHPNLAVGSNNDKRELHYFTGISGTNGDSADANSNNGSTVQGTADAEVYFNMHNSMHHRKSSLNTTLSSANLSTTTNSVNLLHNATVSSRVHYVPELEHGLYDHQLTALYEIFPANQILVLLQEDMYSHTFRTLRQVELFLKIGCFDYQDYAIIPTNSVASKPTFDTDSEEAGDDSLTDDMNINMRDKSSIDDKNPDAIDKNRKKKGKRKGRKKHLKPPRRAPRSYEEKMRHYKAELTQYLASWKRLSMTPSVNLYDNTSPAFKEYLHAVYTSSNNKLSDLLYEKYRNEAFAKEHLEEMGWMMGV